MKVPRTLLALTLAPLTSLVAAQERDVGFETRHLFDEFFCEGACFGDFDGDGIGDVAAGPFWFEGPDFETRHRIYEPKPFDTAGYSDNFFEWARDLNGDDRLDIFMVAFPGQQAFWFENPGPGDQLWERHLVHDNVDNESPHFLDLDGDGQDDLICSSGGMLTWFERDASDPTARWIRHDFSEDIGLGRFTHGMGVGDLNGDGRVDVLLKGGWWEQPASLEGDPLWTHHPFAFSRGQGGAQMLVYDVDGDGDHDVVSSLNAHGYGLSWFESRSGDGGVDFVEHPIMGAKPGEHGCPLAVSELHALELADVDGDGLQDVITGKRFMSHGTSEKGATDPAYLLWFRLERGADGALSFAPHVVHDDSGVGTQVMAGDVDGDGLTDVVVGNKKGAFVHLQRRDAEPIAVPEPPSALADPFPPGGVLAVNRAGRQLNLDFEAGTLADWTAEGEAFQGQPIRGDNVSPRRGDMISDHAGEWWIGGFELHGDSPTGTLTCAPFVVTHPWAAFLIAGGDDPQVRVDVLLVQGDRRIASCTGYNHETLRPTVVDLSEHVGQEAYVQLVDEHTHGWGHINFDHFRLYAERPHFDDELQVSLDVRTHDGLSPEHAARAMTVPEGFRVDLIAGEPDLHQPIALTLDERGRLWVAEAYAYPRKREPEEAQDKILIFEDGDGDGTFETRKLFADRLNLVSGLAVGHGGVYVGAAPELLFIPDRDRDDVPDGPAQVLLDGWGYEDTHETLNAFIWGPDGWLYGCHGVFTHSRVGAPGTPDEQRVPLNAGVWRYHPTRHEFEVFAWGSSNPWGVDFDEHGQAVITACVIPHLFHMIQGGRYLRQGGKHFNPHVYGDIQTIADHLHYIGSTPHSGNNRSDVAGGGHAHCGAMIYLADQWPERYRNTLLMSNIHGNRINNEVLVPSRSGLVGTHADDFLLANDRWFRGINLKYGPDGSVYLIDWYDKQACHLTTPEVWNRTNGRLYRISYGDPDPTPVDVAALDEGQLVELQLHPNEWYARSARRILTERELSAAGRRRLEGVLEEHSDVRSRLRALWTLHCTGTLAGDLLLDQLASDEPYLRAWAIQLACESGGPERRFLAAMERLAASDPSPVVRLYLASALQRLPLRYRWRIAEGLVAHAEDADDPNVPFLVWYGIEPLVSANPRHAMALARACRVPKVRGWIHRRAASDDACHDALIAELSDTRDDGARLAILDQIVTALGRRRGLAMPASWPAAYDVLATASGAVRDRALVLAALFGDARANPALRAKLATRGADLEVRGLALDALVRGRDTQAIPILCALLDEDALRAQALKALAVFDHPDVPRAILAGFQRFDEVQRRDAVSTLTSRAPSALELLDAMERGDVARTALTAFELRKLAGLGDERVDARVAEVWGVFRATAEDRLAEIAGWKALLTDERLAAADLPLGRDVFARTCQRCHTLYGEGLDVGPDITGSNRPDLDYLLQNMVDPNALIANEYRVTVILTTDGRILNGILKEENAEAVTLATENELITLGRDEIDVLKDDPNSMMPQGQLQTISEEEVVALVAYLRHDQQVPRRVTVDGVEAFFDGATLTGWQGDPQLWRVEDGTIVGDSPGIGANSFLVSEYDLADFRLLIDVKLEPNEGNSGIQFRSRVLEGGDMQGYQADIGAGWWGKLYEEHGRALLVGDDRDSAAQPGEWNTYEILAVGDRIQTAINGVPCVDFTDPQPVRHGVVALQIHSGGAFVVRFRNLRLELDPQPVLTTTQGDAR